MNISIDEVLQKYEPWRAKEILQGRLANNGYDKHLFEVYGKLLLSMNDHMEAGKYLFLSGVRHQDYQKAIEIYTERYLRNKSSNFFSSLPRCIKKENIRDFPGQVLNELEEIGYEKKRLSEDLVKYQTNPYPKWSGKGGIVFLIVVILIALGLVALAGSVLIWLINLFI